MGSMSRGGAVLVALLASIPIAVFVTLIVWELFVYVNGGAAPDSLQLFQALFAGLAFGLATFTCLYACRITAD